MSEVETSGRTVLFVSHNMDAMARLCPRTIWLDGGELHQDGPTETVIGEYLRSAAVQNAAALFDVDHAAGAQIVSVALTSGGMPASVLTMSESALLEVELMVNETIPGLDIGCVITNAMGSVMLEEYISDGPAPSIFNVGRYRIRCSIPPVLAPGQFTVGLILGTHYDTIEAHENVVAFEVEGDDLGRSRLFKLGLEWRAEPVDALLDP